MLLVALIEASMLRGAAEATLEVRVSNVVAQNLYQKYGFVQVGRRKGYYHDNHEDALIMTTPRLDEAQFAARIQELGASLHKRLARQVER
jgi:ribosomal-protein-alanine N-acetyltransferase